MQVDESLLFGRSASQELLELETGSKPKLPQISADAERELNELRNHVQRLEEELHSERSRHADENHETSLSLQDLQAEVDRWEGSRIAYMNRTSSQQ